MSRVTRRGRPCWPLLMLLLAWIGCGEAREATKPGERAPTAAAPAQPAAPAPEPAPPAPAATPAPAAAAQAGSGDPARGARQYAALCASCHGERGDADTPIAASLTPRPARHSDGQYMNGLSDDHLFKVIQQGGPAVGKSPLMAPWGSSLKDDQIRDVIAFIRTLADPPYTAPAR